jgi:S1-C subfamily serine protease
VVTLYVDDTQGHRIALGSGFIAPDGRVVTNRHVIEGGSRAEIFGSDGQMLGVASFTELVGTEVDLAVLPAIVDPPGRLALARDLPSVGGSVVVIGAPQGLQNTVSEGIVSAIRSLGAGRVLQITAPISLGSSGAPVLNRNAEVVGVAFSQLSEGQNLNFAVPADAVRALLGSRTSRSPFPAARAPVVAAESSSITANSQPTTPSTPLAPSIPEMGSRWTVVHRDADVIVGVDTSHAQIDERLHRYYLVWMRTNHARTQQLSNGGATFRTAVWRWNVDCRNKQYKPVSGTFYDENGTVRMSTNMPDVPWQTPAPDTFAETGVTGVCAVLRGR